MSDLQPLLDDFLGAHADMPGVLLHVEAPAAGVSWSGAAGVVERGGAPLDGGECFRTASVTKTFVATAVLRLVERGRFALDDVALAHIPEPAASMFAAAVPAAPSITFRHLLQHTSGVFDFGTAAPYRDAIGADPHRVWSATDLIGVAFEHGAPYGPPGEAFHYSDTGYVLLALVLEQHTGLPLAAALRELVGLDALGLTHTWLEGKEPAPVDAPTRVHQYMGRADTFDWDPSFDGYGGGGLVSTSRDLATFVRSLARGAVLPPHLLAEMLRCDAETGFGDMGQRCGLGIFESVIDGVRRVGHEGFWGIWMYHHPDLDITIAGAHTDLVFDQAAKSRLLLGVVERLTGGTP